MRGEAWLRVFWLILAIAGSLALHAGCGTRDAAPAQAETVRPDAAEKAGTETVAKPLYPVLSQRPAEEVRQIYDKIQQAKDAAVVFESLGRFDRAKRRWQDARDLAREEMPEAAWLAADAQRHIDRMERMERFTEAERKAWGEITAAQADGHRLYREKKIAEGNIAFDNASSMAATLWGENTEGHILTIMAAASAAYAFGQYPRAESLGQRALTYAEHVQASENPRLTPILVLLMDIAEERCDSRAVMRYAERGYSLTQLHLTVAGRGRTPLLSWLEPMARAESDAGDFAAARLHQEEAFGILASSESVLDTDCLIRLHIQAGFTELGDGCWMAGNGHAVKVKWLIESLPCERRPEQLMALANLDAQLLMMLGEWYAARAKMRECLHAMDCPPLLNAPNLPVVRAGVLRGLAMILTRVGLFEEGEKALEKSDELFAECLPAGWRIAKNKGCRGFLESQKGNHERAIKLLEEAAEEQKVGQPNLPISYVNTFVLLGKVQNAGGIPAKAEATFLECLAIREKHLREGHPDRGEVLYELGAVYIAQKKYDQADKALAQAEAIYRKAVGERWPVYRNVLRRQVELYRAMDRLSDAAKLDDRVKALDAKYPPLQNLDDLPPSAFAGEPEETAPKPDPA